MSMRSNLIQRLSLLFFTIALALAMFSFTLRELRNWKLSDSVTEPEAMQEMEMSAVSVTTPPEAQISNIEISRQNAITSSIEKVARSVVGITVTQIRYTSSPFTADPFWHFLLPNVPRGFREKVQSIGSGFIYDSDGYIITNAHVVEDATVITVTLMGGKQYSASLIGIDEKSDIALLKIDEAGDYPAAQLANSDEVIVGEWAVALGNPFGLFTGSNTPIATAGIISSIHMDFGIQRSGSLYQNMIQTDASINAGNSGGPLVNALGQVIGINTFIFSGGSNSSGSIGIGFALPINYAIEIVSEIREKGYIDRSYTTGLTIQPINQNLARVLDLPVSEGVIVTKVEVSSPAHKAGIEVGDVIIGVDNVRIRNGRDIINYIRSEDLRHGDKLTFNLLRGSDRTDITVKLDD